MWEEVYIFLPPATLNSPQKHCFHRNSVMLTIQFKHYISKLSRTALQKVSTTRCAFYKKALNLPVSHTTFYKK